MGKLQGFVIHLDNPSAVFQAGNTLTGNVVVDLSEPMKIRGLS